MKLTSVFLHHKKDSPLDWINFDADSGKMLGCSTEISARDRTRFAAQHWSINGNNLIMTTKSGVQKIRAAESITIFKTGE